VITFLLYLIGIPVVMIVVGFVWLGLLAVVVGWLFHGSNC